MLFVYLAALVIGVGTIGLQLLLSGDADAGADAGELEAEVDADADAGAGADADPHPHPAHGPAEGSGILPIFLSLRFWTFAALAFGMVGAPLDFFDLTNPVLTALTAAAMGALSGFTASWTFRQLSAADVTSGAEPGDTVGQVGRVLLPVSEQRPGKIRIQLRGQTLDLLARSDGEAIEPGELVLIERETKDGVQVARAPKDLLPPSS